MICIAEGHSGQTGSILHLFPIKKHKNCGSFSELLLTKKLHQQMQVKTIKLGRTRTWGLLVHQRSIILNNKKVVVKEMDRIEAKDDATREKAERLVMIREDLSKDEVQQRKERKAVEAKQVKSEAARKRKADKEAAKINKKQKNM